MNEVRLDEANEEYLSGLEGRQHWPIAEDIFERPVQELKRRAWVSLDAGETIATAAKRMVSKHIGSVLVTTDGKLSGIVTERDLVNNMVEKPFDPQTTKLADLMKREVNSISSDDTVAVAIHKMSQGRHRHLPMVDKDGKPAGLISVRDIVDYLAVLFPHKILTVPPDSSKIPENREGG